LSSTPGPSRSSLQRVVYLCLGLLMVGLGIIGAILPLMPTTIFLILAAWFFSRSSPRLEEYLLNSQFGGPLRDWRENGAISRKSKGLALFGMSTGYAIFLVASRPSLPLAIIAAVLILACAAYVISRPKANGRSEAGESDV
jgi:uncharacterized protein